MQQFLHLSSSVAFEKLKFYSSFAANIRSVVDNLTILDRFAITRRNQGACMRKNFWWLGLTPTGFLLAVIAGFGTRSAIREKLEVDLSAFQNRLPKSELTVNSDQWFGEQSPCHNRLQLCVFDQEVDCVELPSLYPEAKS